jgi:hypothetical protein
LANGLYIRRFVHGISSESVHEGFKLAASSAARLVRHFASALGRWGREIELRRIGL